MSTRHDLLVHELIRATRALAGDFIESVCSCPRTKGKHTRDCWVTINRSKLDRLEDLCARVERGQRREQVNRARRGT
jgi:hypothetical protein